MKYISLCALFLAYYCVSNSYGAAAALATHDHERIYAFSNPSLRAAYKLCQAFIDFEQSNLETAVSGDTNSPQQNINSGEELKLHIIACNSGEVSQPQLLKTLLNMRFSFLKSRSQIMKIVRHSLDKTGTSHMSFGPTKPESYDQLSPYMQALARTSTDRYQLINQMIINVWQLIDPRTLPANIKELVRCSPTLWPNLLNQREYLGHPDEAILMYDDEKVIGDKDLRLYQNHIATQEWSIQLKGLDCPEGKHTIHTTPYDVSLWDEAFKGFGKIKDMLYPEWLLPQPRVLAPSQLDMKEMSSDSSSSSMANSMLSSDHPVVESSLNVEQSTPNKPLLLIAAPMPQLSDSASAGPAAAPMPQPSGSASVVPVQQISQSSSSRPVQRPIQQVTTTQQDDASLKIRRQQFIDTVFDVRSYNAITFGEFKSFWIGLYGKKSVKEDTGSSHKKLIAGGQTFPIFAHGDGMRYTKNTIKYLRDALRDTGYGPSL